MNEIYKRTNQVQELVKDIKLTISAWKLLFAIDGKTDLGSLVSIIGISEDELESSIEELKDLNLIELESSEDFAEAVGEEEMIEHITKFEKQDVDEVPSEETVEAAQKTKPDFNEDDLEQLLAESHADVEDEAELGIEAVEEETPKSDKEKKGGLALDELVSQIVEQDDEDQEMLTTDDEVDDLEELLTGEMEDLMKNDIPEMEDSEIEAESDIDEDALIADLEKDIQDFMMEEDTQVKEDSEEPDELVQKVEKETVEEEVTEVTEGDELIFDEESATPAPKKQEPAAPAPAAPADMAGRKTVLVVDDSVVIRKMIEIALENEPFNVIAAPTGKEALAKIDEEEIDIIVLDLMLPDLNGLDVLKAVKASSNIPVIILTGKDAPKELQNAKENGADEFLSKPFKDDDLVNKVKTLTTK